MTKITTPVIRETGFFERGRPLILELHPKHLVLRFKGERERRQVTYADILADQERREKALGRLLPAFRRRRP